MGRASVISPLLFILSLIAPILLARMILGALLYPMELEVREGIDWLHVLALKGGLNNFNPSDVAYWNSNSALGPLFKFVLHSVFPFLPAPFVLRMFVLILPLAVFYMSFELLRDQPKFRIASMLALTAVITVGFANLQNYNMLVGRQDPLGLTFFCIQAGLSARLLRDGSLSRWRILSYGAVLALQVVGLWRILPATGTVFLMSAVALWKHDRRTLLPFIATNVVAVLLLHLILFATQYHFDWVYFWKMQFGLYFDSSMGSPPPTNAYDPFPEGLLAFPAKAVPVLLPAVLALAGLAVHFRKTKFFSVLTGALLAICYFLFTYSWHRNQHGSGIYYLSPLIALNWYVCVQVLVLLKSRHAVNFLCGTLLVYLSLAPDWEQIQRQTENLETNRGAVQAFSDELAALYEGGKLMSEELQLFKTFVGDSLVDTGDGSQRFAESGYLGEEFTKTANRFFDLVATGKYEYYLYDGISSGRTSKFLQENYAVVKVGPSFENFNGPGGCRLQFNCPLLLRKKQL